MVGQAMRPMPGELVCGDRCAWWLNAERLVLALADGLGHGEAAARAAEAALFCIGENLHARCEDIFALCDERLLDTRGAALVVGIVDLVSGRMTLGSVGNIRAILLRDSLDLRLGGVRGIVGGGYRKLVPEILQLAPGNVLALFSDGLDELIDLRPIIGAAGASAQAQAQAILDYCERGDDDACVLVYRHLPMHGSELQ